MIYNNYLKLLNKLVAKNQGLYEAHPSLVSKVRASVSAAAGSAVDFPWLEQELTVTGTTKPCQATAITDVIPIASQSLHGTTTAATVILPVKQEPDTDEHTTKPANTTKGNYDNHELSVNITRPTEADINKYTAGSQIIVKPVKLILHKPPLVPSQSVNVAPPKVVVKPTISTLIEGSAPKKSV